MNATGRSNRKLGVEFGAMLLLLLAILAALFHGVWEPGHTLFSNDGPLGRLISACHRFPQRFTGCWSDLNGIGFSGGAAPPGISVGLQALLKPVWFSKLYALISLLILGLGAWCFFAQMRLTPLAARVGGLAAALNSCFFSVACWGVAAQAIAPGLMFFALASLADTTGRMRWWRVVLAGFAVGMCVVDGADVGAIWSLVVAAWVFWQAWIAGGTPAQRMVKASLRLTVVVLCAGFIAAQAISSLVDTSIKGVVVKGVTSTEDDAQTPKTKEARWDWATQWSLPVPETAGLVFPGLFGYRLDTQDGGAYWGSVGQDPSVTRYLENGHAGPTPHGFMRYSGGGFYAGVLVVVVAFWAWAQSFRRKDSVFNLAQRQWLWFWLALAVVSLLLAYGRFAPFYQAVYALPYFSTIRNPVKFIYLVSLALIVLFAYGVDGLQRRYMSARNPAAPGWPGLAVVWGNIGKQERNWLWGCVAVLGIVLLGWIQYASLYQSLVDYLHSVQFSTSAEAIAGFSIRQVGWFVFFLVLAIVLLAGIFGGVFTGTKARWGGLAIGLFLLVDLGRANLPWIIFWNYEDKYASNPIVEILRNQPYEHRVTYLPGNPPPNLPNLTRTYRLEWLQQQFPYYDIQTLDIVDMPRKPVDFASYMTAPSAIHNSTAHQSYLKMWRLTNTRYVLGLADELESWNQDIGQSNQQFRIAARFDLVPKPGVTNTTELDNWTARLDDNGAFALFDFTGALPRAKLYSNWEVRTNDQAELHELFSPDFDPHRTVLVTGSLPAGAAPSSPAPQSGTVDFASYSPRDIVLKSDAPSATVLLLNDHYDPGWKVQVDGRVQPLLLCNYIMRGVYLTPGQHSIEFSYNPPFGLLYVSLAAIGVCLLVLTVVLVVRNDSPETAAEIPAPTAREMPRETMRAAPVKAAPAPPAKVTQKSASSSPPKRPNRASVRK
jgi:hypothetical protein